LTPVILRAAGLDRPAISLFFSFLSGPFSSGVPLFVSRNWPCFSFLIFPSSLLYSFPPVFPEPQRSLTSLPSFPAPPLVTSPLSRTGPPENVCQILVLSQPHLASSPPFSPLPEAFLFPPIRTFSGSFPPLFFPRLPFDSFCSQPPPPVRGPNCNDFFVALISFRDVCRLLCFVPFVIRFCIPLSEDSF